MKFTPTSKFLAVARSQSKVISRKCFFRKTTVLTTALNSGTWIDATRFIDIIPDADTDIESDLGNFTVNSLSLTAKNIAWMNANVLNATAAEYIECKIELLVGFDPADMATDVIYYFSGYLDKDTIEPNEIGDAVTFTVDSADGLMQKIDASAITTQYYEPVHSGIALIAIPGVYVVNCNVASFPLSAGIHTIAYDWNGGYKQARLNDGLWVGIAGGGTFTLGDGETPDVDRQRVSIKVVSLELPKDDQQRTENIVITATGTTLPRTWYTGIALRSIVKNIYTAIGITTNTAAALQCNTFDGTTKNVSFLDCINDGQSTGNMGYSYGIAVKNSTTVYVSSGNRVYSYDPTTGTITYLVSVTAGYVISKLIYNARNDHLWIIFGNNYLDSYGNSLARYVVSTATLSSTITVTDARHFSIALFDFQDWNSVWRYQLIYPETNNRAIKSVDGSTLVVSTLFTNINLGYTSNNGPVIGFAYQLIATDIYKYRFFTSDNGFDKIHEIYFDTADHAPAWANGGIINAAPPFAHNLGGYVSGVVFAFDAGTNDIRKYNYDGSTATNVITLDDDDVVEGMFSDGTYCFVTTKIRRYLHFINNAGFNTVVVNMYCGYAAFASGNSRVYGVDIFGRVFQFHTVMEKYLDLCDFNEQTLKNALTDALRAGNCISTMSFAKAALIYPRGDDAGNPVTSGNVITVNVSNANDIETSPKYGKAYDIIEVDNGKTKINYNGTTYNVLPATLNLRTLTVRNRLIPTTAVKDYCKNFFEYFKTGRTLYTLPVLQTMHHIEPMDAATLDFTITKITSSASSKPIYGVTYKTNGQMKIKVLV